MKSIQPYKAAAVVVDDNDADVDDDVSGAVTGGDVGRSPDVSWGEVGVMGC